jgi:hypothetical protein
MLVLSMLLSYHPFEQGTNRPQRLAKLQQNNIITSINAAPIVISQSVGWHPSQARRSLCLPLSLIPIAHDGVLAAPVRVSVTPVFCVPVPVPVPVPIEPNVQPTREVDLLLPCLPLGPLPRLDELVEARFAGGALGGQDRLIDFFGDGAAKAGREEVG